jgi:hypothetical protein
VTDVNALYQQATHEVFRLEALQVYDFPPESEQLRAFKEGRPLPRDSDVERGMAVISKATEAGVRVHRVHVLDLPLTPYLQFELAAYAADNLRAGEDVRITVRNSHPDLAALTNDFLLFDGDTERACVVWMRYDSQGRITSRDYTTSPDDIAQCRRERDLALAHSLALAQFNAFVEAS